MRVYLGTGGYSNPDWQGLLYPDWMKKNDALTVYRQAFDVVELNSSFYAIPGEKAFAGMLAKSAGQMRFAVKLHQDFTHRREYDADLVARMRQSPQPLREAGVLGPLLAQFPYSFPRTPANRQYLAQLVADFAGEPLAVECRHISWHLGTVQAAFAQQGLIWVSVDYPPLAGMPVADLVLTQRTGYIRLHGRNEAQWWEGKSASERHDYRYREDELRRWADRIIARRDDCDVLYVLFENTTQGHALHNIPVLRQMLRDAGLAVGSGLDEQPVSLASRLLRP